MRYSMYALVMFRWLFPVGVGWLLWFALDTTLTYTHVVILDWLRATSGSPCPLFCPVSVCEGVWPVEGFLETEWKEKVSEENVRKQQTK